MSVTYCASTTTRKRQIFRANGQTIDTLPACGRERDKARSLRIPVGNQFDVHRYLPLRDILDLARHDGCGGRAGRAELLTGIEGASRRVAGHTMPPHAPAMFVVTEADEAAIRAVYQQHGEFAAAIELRRRFPGLADTAQARECVRTIAGWKPLPLRTVKRARGGYGGTADTGRLGL